MSNSEKKVIGIWIDNRNAYLFGTPGTKASGNFSFIEKIEIDDHKDDMYKNDKTDLNKERQEIRKTYREIESHANNMDVLYIFGPGKAQEQLKNHLEENHHYKNKQISLGSSAQMTVNQMIHHLEEHFK
jgi:stalled ribosome rescue protein Dom34